MAQDAQCAPETVGLLSYCPDVPGLLKQQAARGPLDCSMCISNVGNHEIQLDPSLANRFVKAIFIAQQNHVGRCAAVCSTWRIDAMRSRVPLVTHHCAWLTLSHSHHGQRRDAFDVCHARSSSAARVPAPLCPRVPASACHGGRARASVHTTRCTNSALSSPHVRGTERDSEYTKQPNAPVCTFSVPSFECLVGAHVARAGRERDIPGGFWTHGEVKLPARERVTVLCASAPYPTHTSHVVSPSTINHVLSFLCLASRAVIRYLAVIGDCDCRVVQCSCARYHRTREASIEPRPLSDDTSCVALVRRELFPECSKSSLRWANRRKTLLAQVSAIDADILCLQECDFYDEFWQPELQTRGYLSFYSRKPNGKRDGCATFWKADRYEQEHVIDAIATY